MSLWKRLTEHFSGRREEDLDRQLRAHLDLDLEEQEEEGLPPQKARYAARWAFGNLTSAKENVREVWGRYSLGQLAQDRRRSLHDS